MLSSSKVFENRPMGSKNGRYSQQKIRMVILLHMLNMMQDRQSISSKKMVSQDLIGEHIVS